MARGAAYRRPEAEVPGVSLSDARTRLVGRLRRRKMREREGLVLVEGVRGVRDALKAGVPFRFSVVSPRLFEVDPELATSLGRAGEVVAVSDDEMAALSDTEAPQGVLAVVPEPDDGWFDALGPDARLLVLDALQDPGNVGTLVRAAAAFALDGVVLLDGTVDPWNPKAVRASAGAVFRCPVALRDWSAAAARLETAGLPVLVADAAGADPVPPPWHGGWALVVGSEGHGVREGVRAVAAAVVRVPMPGGTESLNAAVAGSILLFELTRRDGGHRA